MANLLLNCLKYKRLIDGKALLTVSVAADNDFELSKQHLKVHFLDAAVPYALLQYVLQDTRSPKDGCHVGMSDLSMEWVKA